MDSRKGGLDQVSGRIIHVGGSEKSEDSMLPGSSSGAGDRFSLWRVAESAG